MAKVLEMKIRNASVRPSPCQCGSLPAIVHLNGSRKVNVVIGKRIAMPSPSFKFEPKRRDRFDFKGFAEQNRVIDTHLANGGRIEDLRGINIVVPKGLRKNRG